MDCRLPPSLVLPPGHLGGFVQARSAYALHIFLGHSPVESGVQSGYQDHVMVHEGCGSMCHPVV